MLEVIMTKNTSSRLLFGLTATPLVVLARIFHELLSRDHEDGCACPPSRACSLRRGGRATWQPQGVGSEGVPERYVAGGACPEPVEGTPEDARKDGHIRGCSKSFMKHPG